MDISSLSRKEVGNMGERVAAEFLRKNGFEFIECNFSRKTGELDLVCRKKGTVHFVEVKTLACRDLPDFENDFEHNDPSENLHQYKIRKVVRTAEWYVAERNWEGRWQVDAVLVWLRLRDGMAYVRYLPQIL